MSQYDLLLTFDADDPQFVRGFEAGRMWALLRERRDEVIEEHVHASNAELILRMAEATERSVSSEELGEEWLVVTFTPPRYVDSA